MVRTFQDGAEIQIRDIFKSASLNKAFSDTVPTSSCNGLELSLPRSLQSSLEEQVCLIATVRLVTPQFLKVRLQHSGGVVTPDHVQYFPGCYIIMIRPNLTPALTLLFVPEHLLE